MSAFFRLRRRRRPVWKSPDVDKDLRRRASLEDWLNADPFNWKRIIVAGLIGVVIVVVVWSILYTGWGMKWFVK